MDFIIENWHTGPAIATALILLVLYRRVYGCSES